METTLTPELFLKTIQYFDTSYKGWKRGFFPFRLRLGNNFDTSYKGWKHRSEIRRPVFIPSNFDTSYKGWKHEITDVYMIANPDFDTSYKGWKHVELALMKL